MTKWVALLFPAILSAQETHTYRLKAGDIREISVGVDAPSKLPPNARIAVEWAGFRKVLHAFDPDFYLVFRAPKTAAYDLRISPVTAEEPIFNSARWRETGTVTLLSRFPKNTPDPGVFKTRFSVRAVKFGSSYRNHYVETEPNNSIAEAQPLPAFSGAEQNVHITGSADDIEYFDNGAVGSAGDDWFRIEYKGGRAKLFTANLTVTDPMVVAQLRFYTGDGKEFKEGANANERVHQQTEEHRTGINRTLQPGTVYFLRVEANSPGYDLELRTRDPAPYTDPRKAIRQAMYDHLAQVHAWLQNRPRGASVERRIRDVGSMLGSHCMSCHTQSGVWGPAGAMLNGYRPENVFNYRHLINIAYESLRPTNTLKDAANNTSLPPLDLGDGPAGTRVAGYNITTLERFLAPRRLHSLQQLRTANFVMQSSDPSGVNAAGPGSNAGQAVVYRYAGEILRRAWHDTPNKRFLTALDEKAAKLLQMKPKYTDDYAHRIIFFETVYPKISPKIGDCLEADEAELRARQRPDGSWGFDSGGKDPKDPDPAPTALTLEALHARGHDASDPAVAKGVAALLRMQDPYGRWNRAALTGFVTTAYALHALSTLFPEEKRQAPSLHAIPGESLADTAGRYRALAHLGLDKNDRRYLREIRRGAHHASPQVRYWAMLGLGAMPDDASVPLLIRALCDPVKMVREAARWSLRQNLIDDRGWPRVLAAYETGADLTREQIAAALIMRVDTVLTKSTAGAERIAALIGRMMNDDPHPAVRAWATRAAWNWWIWNPPIREAINASLLRMLESPESSILAENAKRYQVEALFIANGQRANGSKEYQYPELAKLFEAISRKLDTPCEPLVSRIVAIAGTFYATAGGDGGPGQMGYVTANSSDMAGKAVLAYWTAAERGKDAARIRLSIEAAANALYQPMQKKLLEYAVSGPEHLRTIAATSVSDPRVIALPGTQEFLEPLIDQLKRGAADSDRRKALSDPIFRLFTRARWNIPKTEEQQRIFYELMLPALDDPKSDTQWYLAEQLGRVFGSNPDLQTDRLAQLASAAKPGPLSDQFWLQNVPWLLTFRAGVPAPGNADHPASPLRSHAEQIYTRALSEKADDRTRRAALALAADERVRNDAAIAPMLRKSKPEYFESELPEVSALSSDWLANFNYFRNYVVPELKRADREDEQACLTCHGVAGRVPSMELAPADRAGYLSAKAVWTNYRTLLDRVNENDVEQSKLLRKPLNVQTGQEDGHQGGRRYSPGDRGYEVIRRWAQDAAKLKKTAPLPEALSPAVSAASSGSQR